MGCFPPSYVYANVFIGHGVSDISNYIIRIRHKTLRLYNSNWTFSTPLCVDQYANFEWWWGVSDFLIRTMLYLLSLYSLKFPNSKQKWIFLFLPWPWHMITHCIYLILTLLITIWTCISNNTFSNLFYHKQPICVYPKKKRINTKCVPRKVDCFVHST